MFQTNQNILKILSCIENANINIQSTFHVLTVFCFRVAPKTKIDFLENTFCVRILVYLNFSYNFNVTNKIIKIIKKKHTSL